MIKLVGVVFNNEREVLLGKQASRPTWTFPGGKFDWNRDATLQDALLRELREETNLCEPEILQPLGIVESTVEAKSHVYYLVYGCQGCLKNMEPHKFTEWEWVPIKNLIDEVRNYSTNYSRRVQDFVKEIFPRNYFLFH